MAALLQFNASVNVGKVAAKSGCSLALPARPTTMCHRARVARTANTPPLLRHITASSAKPREPALASTDFCDDYDDTGVSPACAETLRGFCRGLVQMRYSVTQFQRDCKYQVCVLAVFHRDGPSNDVVQACTWLACLLCIGVRVCMHEPVPVSVSMRTCQPAQVCACARVCMCVRV